MDSIIHEEAFMDVLASLGKMNQNFCYSDFTGMTTKEVFQKYFKKQSYTTTEENINELVKRKQRLAFERLTSKPPLKMGVHDILLKLSLKFSLGLATSGSSDLVIFLEASKQLLILRVFLRGKILRENLLLIST
jgi:hypothetical protein